MAVGTAGQLRPPSASLDAARSLFRRTVECSRREQGCLAYTIAEDPIEVGLFWVLEVWADEAALQAHRATTHLRELREAISSLEIEVAVERWSDLPWSTRLPS